MLIQNILGVLKHDYFGFIISLFSLFCIIIFIIIVLFVASFNRIDIPKYETYDKLVEKLTFAIEHTAGFHVE